ncbi:MAG: electron transfer flavoprotein subunit beta/FixA family protein [Actinobacteria bacterium]|nr:electron transfer flavoprotein subunit beta/FixA family protein [Actinomycetota bacterium]MBU1944925.1 electron transfer flavoprotein subunit beta/FixA family protein [Actinomycetota bacterium]MBU2688149.1 electron transfer flavoprotein subunit beta/FixA family protein [Actinomycetota bacterium]
MHNGLNMIVCVKQVPDPEGPPTSYRVDEEARTVTFQGIPPVVSPFDENALELALGLAGVHGGTVTLMSLGSRFSPAVMLKALATGADDLVLVEMNGDTAPDSFATARLLAAAISRRGGFDLVLAGIQASDTNAGQVGPGIAELLGIPVIPRACHADVTDGRLVVKHAVPGGHETVGVPLRELPVVLTVGFEAGELRYPHLAAIKAAKEKPQARWDASDVAGMSPPGNLLEIVGLRAPKRERRCLLIEGDTPEEQGESLAVRLREDGVL